MGNEPDGWGLSSADYNTLARSFAAGIQAAVPGTPLVGLAWASAYVSLDLVKPFVAASTRPQGLSLISVHGYGGDGRNASETVKAALADDHIHLPFDGLTSKFGGV